MELRPAGHADIAGMRDERKRSSSLSLTPRFYTRLAGEAQPFFVFDGPPAGGAEAAQGAGTQGAVPVAGAASQEPAGYALLLERPHHGHSHVTLIEMYLRPTVQHRYEDALELIRERHSPTAYLVRTDDCLLSAVLLARGLQAEPTALVMLPAEEPGPDAAAMGSVPKTGLVLEVFDSTHLPGVEALLEAEEEAARARHAASAPGNGQGSVKGNEGEGVLLSEQRDELRRMAQEARGWVITEDGRPVAVVARWSEEDGDHDLLDLAVARAPEAVLAWGLRRAGGMVRAAGRRPAAVIDALETVRRRVFRQAGYHTAAAYVVFYDPQAGRPSVGVLRLEDLRAMMDKGERFRLVDVMGEEHWRHGHLPGAEWLDFRGLAREARRRYRADETIVLYCNGFT